MDCIAPLKASIDSDGNITHSSKKAIPGLIPVTFPCRKCLPCRLNIAREKAVRVIHEAHMHNDNIFLTLTYDDQNLISNKLVYEDFQKFIKKLRIHNDREIKKSDYYIISNEEDQKKILEENKITYMVTGEYGEKNKRPHWHAIIFNYRPNDHQYIYTTDNDHKVFTSNFLTKLWGKGMIEFGSVTMDSAGYVARYAAKKLVHGKDEDHDYHPIHKTSSKRGIGLPWIKKYWKHTFSNGFIVLPTGETCKIPRYYIDWLKKNHFNEYLNYIKNVQPKIIKKAEIKARKEEMEYLSQIMNYKGGKGYPLRKKDIKKRILETKFKKLQEHLKL